MDLLTRARNYLDRMPPAVSGQGGHDQTFRVACVLVHGFGLSQADARPLMIDYSARCQPPWKEKDIDHKLADAERTPEPKGRGYLLKGFKHVYQGRTSPENAPGPSGWYQHTAQPDPAAPSPKAAPARYAISDAETVPEPLLDGTRQLLLAAFEPGEGIRIALAKNNEEGTGEIPKDSGIVFSREEWLAKLATVDGNPNKLMHSPDRNGIFISVNPMKVGGKSDADATAFRHCLLEFDKISLPEQWGLIVQSRIPVTAVLYSGGKSLHAWVKIDAQDRREFDDRVTTLYGHFADYKPDIKNRNPSRFSRLPNCERGKARQELLALKMGAESFSEWLIDQEVDDLGTEFTISKLLEFQADKDPNTVLGERWLCRGGSCLIVGQSGTGKSSLAMQLAILWALERPAFGILPAKPIRSLFIQAENDLGDMAEMFQGVWQGMGLPGGDQPEYIRAVNERIAIRKLSTHTGPAFCQAARRLIDKHKPDLVWIDPANAYIGDDIAKQSVCAQFFRNGLNPIAEATGVIWMIMHHTTKPPKEAKAKQGWNISDWSYEGAGSADLTNWARAVLVLVPKGDNIFELKLPKRGRRAGARDPHSNRTTSVWMQQSRDKICWNQIPEPEEEEAPAKKSSRSSSSSKERNVSFDYDGFLATLANEHFNTGQLVERVMQFSNIGKSTAWAKILPELKRRMTFDPEFKTYSTE